MIVDCPMSSASSRKGAQYERDIIAYLRSHSFDAERLRPVGVEDEGDIAVRMKSGEILLIEAKAENRIELPAYLRELHREMENYARHRSLEPTKVAGLVVIKRRLASVGESYVVSTLERTLGIKK